MPAFKNIEELFRRCLVDANGCWVYQTGRSLSPTKYKVTYFERKAVYVHRLAFYLANGKWPDHEIDHLCRNRHCCNPAHLEDVTQLVNGHRGLGVGAKNAAKTHCPKGHPYSEENTLVRRQTHSGRGIQRRCLICVRTTNREKMRQTIRDAHALGMSLSQYFAFKRSERSGHEQVCPGA